MSIKKVLTCISALAFSLALYSHSASAASHTVKTGEDLVAIADHYDTTTEVLLDLNNLESEDEVILGLVLQLPDHIKNKPAIEKEEEVQSEQDFEVVKTLKVNASAYTAHCTGCSGISAYGINLKKTTMKVISVDPKVIPLGTKVWVEGYGIAIAGDTGGSIKGNKIDILVADKATAYKWGRRTVTIKILK